MNVTKILIAFLILMTQTMGFSQDMAFTAKASKKTLGINQRVKIEFSINQNGGDNFQAPNFEGFKVVAGPSTSVSQSWINGKSSFNQSYIYFLQPIAKGIFKIAPATITFKGQVISSNALELTITDEVKDPNNPNDPSSAAQENISLVAHISNENPYVGESIYVEYRLYFTNKIEFSNAQFGENPKYEGFWNQEIEINNYDKQTGEYKGENYNYFVLKKAVLIPQKSGTLKVEPINMDILVGVPSGKYDFFGYPLIQNTQQHYSSGLRTIRVKPLPEEGKPLDYTGAVGSYDMKVSANRNSINTNESAKIGIEITGLGNFKLFELPKLVVPAQLEVYPPERSENLKTTVNGLKGRIVENYNLVANYNGKYIIPEVTFSYFDPKDRKYHQLSSSEIVMDVQGENISTSSSPNNDKQKVAEIGKNIKYIQTETSFKPILQNDFYGSTTFYTLLGLPFLSVPLFILVGNRRKKRAKDVVGNKQKEAEKLSKKYLSEAKKHLGDKVLFYESLEKALHNFLKARLKIETKDISQERITELLREKTVKESNIQDFINVLNDCNYARYTPYVKGMMDEELKKAAQIIQSLNAAL